MPSPGSPGSRSRSPKGGDSAAPTADGHRPRRILVVDDEKVVREFFQRALLLAGYDVVTASSGAEGLKMLAVDPSFRLIILDLNMPHVDGWAFRKVQLSDARLATIPTVIVTGAGPDPVKDGDLRASACLRKPVGTAELVGTVRRHSLPAMDPVGAQR